MHSGSLTGVVCAVALAVSACGGGDDQVDAAATPLTSTATASVPPIDPGPSSSGEAAPVDCKAVLPQRAAEMLAGEELGAPQPEPISSLPGCRWESKKTGSWVIALSVPAADWAQAVPDVVAAALDSGEEFEGREALQEARRLIEDEGGVDNASACAIFSTIATALQGSPEGATKVFTYVPTEDAAQGINQQACLDGRYYSLQFVSAQLKPGPALEKRVGQALSTLTG